MKNYKITITKTYTIDVTATARYLAEAEAENILDKAMLNGTEHYLQTGDTEFTVFDVTGTDDAPTEEVL